KRDWSSDVCSSDLHFPSLALPRSGSKNSEVSPRSQLDTQALPVLSEYLFVLKRYHKFQICQINWKTNERELHKYYSFFRNGMLFYSDTGSNHWLFIFQGFTTFC